MSKDENENHAKQFQIIVNAQKKPWDGEIISYSEVVGLAFPSSHGKDEIITVKYSLGARGESEGTLVKGETVKIRNGMVFDVIRTDKS